MEMWPYNNQTLKSSSGFGVDGGAASTPLYLTGDPTQSLQAATKQYVDYIVGNIPASKVDTGTLAVARLPAFTGDVTSVAGTGTLTLANSGVTPGTYTKVTVDANGRVTAGANLLATDIPNLNWSKITSGKPTTLEGYGITNGLAKSGGTLTAYLSDPSYPSQPLHASNKNYIDNWFTGASSVMSGSIVKIATPTTPPGFLRCNGALVNKTAYPALYAVYGDNAESVYKTPVGEGQPWRLLYQSTNTPQSTDVTDWAVSNSSFSSAAMRGGVVVTKNRVYFIGGGIGSDLPIKTVRTATVNADGTLGTWSTVSPIPAATMDMGLFVTKSRVYLAGGFNGSSNVSQTYYAPIDSDGVIGTWVADSSLPVALGYSAPVVTKSKVYLISGKVGNQDPGSTTVLSAPIDTNGVVGTWVTDTPIPVAVYAANVVTTKNRVYLLGGRLTASTRSAAVYTAPINSDGTIGSWTSSGTLPSVLSNSCSVVTAGQVFLFGGVTSGGVINTVYNAPVNADGTLGAWTTGTSLPEIISSTVVAATSGKIHIISGWGSGGLLSKVYTATFSGGSNDYYSTFSQGYISTDPDNFLLPDYSPLETADLKYYIKY